MKEVKFGRVITQDEIRIRTSAVWPYMHDPGRPVDSKEIDEIMDGLIDIHCHGAPAGGWQAGRPSIVQTTMEASKEGVAGIVFKDHNTMTNNFGLLINECTQIIKELKEKLGEEFKPTKLYGSLVLNYPIGGLNPVAVKTALSGYGDCVEIWLPSTSAKWQLDNIAAETGKPNNHGIVVSENGELVPELIKILDIMAEHNNNSEGKRVALQTCHVTNQEKFDVLRYIKKKGMDIDVIMTHITQELTIASEDEMLEMIDLGAYIEFSETSCVPWAGMQDWIINFDFSFTTLKNLLNKKGPEHIILSSDSGQPGHEYVPGMRSFIRTLLAKGISKEDIRIMSRDIPKKVCGIDA